MGDRRKACGRLGATGVQRCLSDVREGDNRLGPHLHKVIAAGLRRTETGSYDPRPNYRATALTRFSIRSTARECRLMKDALTTA